MTRAVELDSETSLLRIQASVAKGRSVLVLGPGCQRVGFDAGDSSGWREVHRRMQLLAASIPEDDEEQRKFLESFWRSKLSDEIRNKQPSAETDDEYVWLPEELTLFPREQPEASEPRRVSCDRARILWLARPLLALFSQGTSRLGAVVSEGLTPVINWYDVNDLRLRGSGGGLSPTDAVVPDFEPKRSTDMDPGAVVPDIADLEDQIDMLLVATQLFRQWKKDETRPVLESPILPPISVREGDDQETLSDFLSAAQSEVLALCFAGFREHCISGPEARLSGANVEWLGDLLWHVVTCDAEVPPSQSELAFFINLPSKPEHVGPDTFVRPRPGEYRFASDMTTEERDADLRLILQSRTRALTAGRTLAAGPLRDLYRSLAGILTAQSDESVESETRRPLAMVAGYDLVLEQHVLEALAPEQSLHVVAPVWITTEFDLTPILEWVLVTIKRPNSVKDNTILTAPRTVRWLRHTQSVVKGEPVILRVAGAPFLPLLPLPPGHAARLEYEAGSGPGQLDIGSREGRSDGHDEADPDVDDVFEIRPALIFEEYEASLVFRRLAKVSPGWLSGSLSWLQRSWLFLGEGFPEWIPRLRLLYTSSLGVAEGKRRLGGTSLMAVDRVFSWPEASLLSALGIQCYRGDLKELKALTTMVPKTDTETQDFVNAVRLRIGGAA